MALATTDVFAVGSCYYGVTDLQLLLDSTHKYESGYLYRLTGTSPGRTAEVFAARSPLKLAGQIRAPVILFQGLDDKVVPPDQATEMAAVLRRNGVRAELIEFAGEGHGFRQAATITTALERELAFLTDVLGLDRG